MPKVCNSPRTFTSKFFLIGKRKCGFLNVAASCQIEIPPVCHISRMVQRICNQALWCCPKWWVKCKLWLCMRFNIAKLKSVLHHFPQLGIWTSVHIWTFCAFTRHYCLGICENYLCLAQNSLYRKQITAASQSL